MNTTQLVQELGATRQWLHMAIKFLDIKPHQTIVDGRVHNDFTKDQVEQLKKLRSKITPKPRKPKEARHHAA
jgi:hypothetical protein